MCIIVVVAGSAQGACSLASGAGALTDERGVWVIAHPQELAYRAQTACHRAQSSGDSEAVSAQSGQTVTDLPGHSHSSWSPLMQTSG